MRRGGRIHKDLKEAMDRKDWSMDRNEWSMFFYQGGPAMSSRSQSG